MHFLIILLAQRAALVCCFWKQLRLRRSHSMASVSLSPSSYFPLSRRRFPQRPLPHRRDIPGNKIKALGFLNPSTWHLRAHTTRTSQSNADHLLLPTTPHPGLKVWRESWDRVDMMSLRKGPPSPSPTTLRQ